MADDPPLADETTRHHREWRIIKEDIRPGPMQMALDEVAARTAANGGPRTVRVYTWEPSTLSLGYSQDPETVDWEFCFRNGITVTRRPTGGGGIFHDHSGDVSYSIVAPKSELPGDLMDCYHLLCTPILAAFDHVGAGVHYTDTEVPALHEPACYLRGLHPAHDMVAADGRKIAGNAQYRQRDAVVHHGSLTYEVAAEPHLGCFAGHDLTADAFRDRVTGVAELVNIDRTEFVEAVETALSDWTAAHEGSWTDAELDAAQTLASEKYGTAAWVQDAEDPT